MHRMTLFGKKKEFNKNQNKNSLNSKKNTDDKSKKLFSKTKSKDKKSSRKMKKSKKKKENDFELKKNDELVKNDKSLDSELNDIKNDFVEDLLNNNETVQLSSETVDEKTSFSSKKKKAIIKKDMNGKPVFLEDTGEKIGTVFGTIYDNDKNIIGFKIKDGKSDAVLSFPYDQFDYDKDGLIFVPGWYNNASRIVEKLEFKDRVSPELTALLSDDEVSNEELYEIFVKHDNDMVKYIDDAKSLREMLNSRLRALEKKRLTLKEDLMDLTEKRLIKDIDRRQFSEDVLNHRRKVNVLDVNINKCKELIDRLDKTSFGVLGKKNLLFDKDSYVKETNIENNLYKNVLNSDKKVELNKTNENNERNDVYKQKYFLLKAEYDELEENFQELKIAVDKLLHK